MLAKLRENKSHPTKNTKHRSFVSSETWFESKKTDPPVNSLKGFHRASVLVETFAATSETCSTGWGQRLALCMTLLPLSLLPQLLPTRLVRPPRHTSTCHPLLLASPFVAVALPFFYLSLPSLCSPPHPRSHSHPAGNATPLPCWWSEQQQQGGTAVTFRGGRCFSVPQFPPVKHEPCSLPRYSTWKSPGGRCHRAPQHHPQPPWRALPSSGPHQGSPLPPREDFALWQAAVLLSQLTWLLESSPERRYWSNTGCFVWAQYSAFSIICQSSLVVWKFVGLST